MTLETEIAEVLAAPLETLLDLTHQVLADSRIDQWDLPPSDRHALRAWGLPEGPLFRPGLQAASAPVLVPNVAGECERRLIAPDQRLYVLGRYGSELLFNGEDLTYRVGAVVGSGRVLGMHSRPLTIEDIPQVLRALPPDFSRSAVRFINSSVAAFVEVGWRWRAALTVLLRYPCPNELEEMDAWYDQQDAVFPQVLAGMVRIDPALAEPQLDSLWVDMITTYYNAE